MSSQKFPGIYKSLAKISDFVTENAEKAGLNDKEIYSVQLAVDEACTNIIEHAYGGEGNGDIECICVVSTDGLEITIIDEGSPFNPDEVPEVKIDVKLEDLKSRGAGLFLMRNLMDEVNFDFKNGEKTVLRMTKKKSE